MMGHRIRIRGIVCIGVVVLTSFVVIGYRGNRISLRLFGTVAAERSQSLKEGARQAGGRLVSVRSPNSTRYDDLQQLAAASDAIIVGTVDTNVCRLTVDGQSINIVYTIRVQEQIKGAYHRGDGVTVSVPGGKVRFEDGSTAEVATPWFKKMVNGHTYVLFLAPDSSGGGMITAGGPEGVFEVDGADGKVKGHSGIPGDPIGSSNHGRDAQDFLKEIRRIVQVGGRG